jgi:hypothetical protein
VVEAHKQRLKGLPLVAQELPVKATMEAVAPALWAAVAEALEASAEMRLLDIPAVLAAARLALFPARLSHTRAAETAAPTHLPVSGTERAASAATTKETAAQG